MVGRVDGNFVDILDIDIIVKNGRQVPSEYHGWGKRCWCWRRCDRAKAALKGDVDAIGSVQQGSVGDVVGSVRRGSVGDLVVVLVLGASGAYCLGKYDEVGGTDTMGDLDQRG